MWHTKSRGVATNTYRKPVSHVWNSNVGMHAPCRISTVPTQSLGFVPIFARASLSEYVPFSTLNFVRLDFSEQALYSWHSNVNRVSTLIFCTHKNKGPSGTTTTHFIIIAPKRQASPTKNGPLSSWKWWVWRYVYCFSTLRNRHVYQYTRVGVAINEACLIFRCCRRSKSVACPLRTIPLYPHNF